MHLYAFIDTLKRELDSFKRDYVSKNRGDPSQFPIWREGIDDWLTQLEAYGEKHPLEGQ